jgi:hypothetical protein
MPEELTTDERAQSILARVEQATRKAPLAATRKVELAGALLWLIDMAEQLAHEEEQSSA